MSTAFNGAQPEIKVFDNSEVKKPREPAEKKHCGLENKGTQLPYSHMAFGWESNLCRECGERERGRGLYALATHFLICTLFLGRFLNSNRFFLKEHYRIGFC